MSNSSCGCRALVPTKAPYSVANRPGLERLRARVGTHPGFWQAMLERLSCSVYPRLSAEFRRRQGNDASLALLDAWCTAADVLTFYTERIVNEAYLRTATEHRSLVELARLVGYEPGPGVAANVLLAFALEANAETLIPAGTAVRGLPQPKENSLPPTYETSVPLAARAEWNAIRPRMSLPPRLAQADLASLTVLDVAGANTQLEVNDCLLIYPDPDPTPTAVAGGSAPKLAPAPQLVTVRAIEADNVRQRTRIVLAEHPLSRTKLFREFRARADTFLRTLEELPSFVSQHRLEAIAAMLALRDGNAQQKSLTNGSALLEFDRRLTAWAQGFGSWDTAAVVRALPPGGVHQEIASRLDATRREFADQTLQICDAVATYARLAQGMLPALAAVVADDLQSYLQAQAALPTAAELPTTGLLVEHRASFQNIMAAVNQLGSSADAYEKFAEERTRFQNWWAPVDNDLARIRSYHAEVAELSRLAVAPLVPVEDLLRAIAFRLDEIEQTAGALQSVELQARVADAVAAIAVQPVLFRRQLAELRDALRQYANDGDLLAEFSPQLEAALQNWLAVQEDEPPLKWFTEAQGAAPHIATLSRGYFGLAMAIATTQSAFQSAAELRRNEFRRLIKEVCDQFRDLKSYPGDDAAQAQQAWKIIDDLVRSPEFQPNGEPVPPAASLEALSVLADQARQAIAALQQNVNAPPLQVRLSALVGALQNSVNIVAQLVLPSTSANEALVTTAAGLGALVKPDDSPAGQRLPFHRSLEESLSLPAHAATDVVSQLVAASAPDRAGDLVAAWKKLQMPASVARCVVLSRPFQLFGYNAPRPVIDGHGGLRDPRVKAEVQDWQIADADWQEAICLAQEVTGLSAASYLRLSRNTGEQVLYAATNPRSVARSDYGLSSKVTTVRLGIGDWRAPTAANEQQDASIACLRNTLVEVESRDLTIIEADITQPLGPGSGADNAATSISSFDFAPEVAEIELDGLYVGLEPGRQIIVEGESQQRGVIVSEPNRIKYVRHLLRDLPGDTVHTRIFLAQPLAHTFVRVTVKVYANVVGATHGETVRQVLGSGDGERRYQQFTLAKRPLTYLAAPTASGVSSTLQVRVNGLEWQASESLFDLGPHGRGYQIERDDAQQATVRFGDGERGARLPTGRENVTATYRVGLGRAGNVGAGQINLLLSRPAGVKDVVNPLPAAGGIDPEPDEQIRANAPLAVMALDRLVSLQDYADFARNYAAIDKAAAQLIQLQRRRIVYVTIAGANDVDIDPASDVYQNLLAAYERLGEAQQEVRVANRDLLVLFLSAQIRVAAGYLWELVEPRVRAALFQQFGFYRQQLGQPVYLSDVVATIHRVPGVEFVDIDTFGGLSATDVLAALRENKQATPAADSAPGSSPLSKLFATLASGRPAVMIDVAGARVTNGEIWPAQLARLAPEIPDSLYLREIV